MYSEFTTPFNVLFFFCNFDFKGILEITFCFKMRKDLGVSNYYGNDQFVFMK